MLLALTAEINLTPVVSVKRKKVLDSTKLSTRRIIGDKADFSARRSALTGQQIQQAWADLAELSRWDNIVRTLQDKMVDTKRVVDAIRKAGIAVKDAIDPYLQETLHHGRAAKRVEDFAEKELRPLLVEMQMRQIGRQELEDYLWARHATERNAQIARINPKMPDGGSGLASESSRLSPFLQQNRR